jgi:acetolactate synthase I/II/III large subunit
MNGAESLIKAAVDCGVEVCFANPGTTEMPFVAALDTVKGMRSVLGLFEGVCTGAADGYARMTDKPAMTLLHLGPGFANGIANLHNARRAHTPLVNVVGNHATWHLPYDAPLTSDIVSLANPVSGWVRENASADTLAADMAQAITASLQAPGQVATLIVPHDYQLAEVGYSGVNLSMPSAASISVDAIEHVAKLLHESKRVALFLGGKALRAAGLKQAGRIAAATGCQLIAETMIPRLDHEPHLPPLQRLPYFPKQALQALAPFDTLIFIGAKKPVSFFGYEGIPSVLVSQEQESFMLATVEDDVIGALTALADAIGAAADATVPNTATLPALPTGALNATTVTAAVVNAQPEGAIIVDEGVSTTGAYLDMASAAKPFTYLRVTGGAIGFGIPAATGAAIACPDRPVINIEADGSAMYTVQALWTQARESLNVTTLICSNRRYNILQTELRHGGFDIEGQHAQSLTSLSNPPIDWRQVANGFGIPAVRVERTEDLTRELQRALAEAGPHLIEILL